MLMVELDKYKNTVVLCNTNDELKDVAKRIVELGGRDLDTPLVRKYLRYKGVVCFTLRGIEIKENRAGLLNYYKRHGYATIPAKEFLELFKKDATVNNYEIY